MGVGRCFVLFRRLAVAIAAVGLGRVLVRRNQIIRHGHGGRGDVRYFVVYERTAKGYKAESEQAGKNDDYNFDFLFLFRFGSRLYSKKR